MFRLQPDNSLAGAVPADIDGETRDSQPDAGADELPREPKDSVNKRHGQVKWEIAYDQKLSRLANGHEDTRKTRRSSARGMAQSQGMMQV